MRKRAFNPAVCLLLCLLAAILSLACFGFPIYVIRPFRAQGVRELAAALFVLRIGPVASLICVLLTGVSAWLLWSNSRKWLPRAATVLLVLFACGGSYLSRVDVYELMFHPIDAPSFQSAEKVRLDGDDMVIAVKVKGAHRAYPVREMAYHHIVNDNLRGEPIVATY